MHDTVDAYTHRIGRTGRAERTGDAFTFVTSQDRAFVRNIETVLGEKIERCTLEDFDYTVPAPAGNGADDGARHFARQGSPRKSQREIPAQRGAPSSHR